MNVYQWIMAVLAAGGGAAWQLLQGTLWGVLVVIVLGLLAATGVIAAIVGVTWPLWIMLLSLGLLLAFRLAGMWMAKQLDK